MNFKAALEKLNSVIKKSRIHAYKPIQIAEILYRHRTQADGAIDLLNLESYRVRSRTWRDVIAIRFLGRTSTSSARFQDNLFEENAIPPDALEALGRKNCETNGSVEKYIYEKFEAKHFQLNSALEYCLRHDSANFDLREFINSFWTQAGLKRSIDKIFEIIVYSIFETLLRGIQVKIDVYYPDAKKDLIIEFEDFSKKVIGLDSNKIRETLDAHFYRVGVTNAADRGLDIYANFGSAIQVKHLSLSEDTAEGITNTITSDKIIIVCKSAEINVIRSLLGQLGWRSRIQSVITIEELIQWYEKALRGQYSHLLANNLLSYLADEIQNEFPSVGNDEFSEFKRSRGYSD